MAYSIYAWENDEHTEKVEFAKTYSLEYNGEWMGERYLNVSVKSHEPINFEVGDFIEYRGEVFEIKSAVGIKKQAVKDTYGEGFIYSNIKFQSFTDELVAGLCLNCTYTEESSNITGSLLSEFTIHCVDVRDLGNLIQANLNRLYGTDAWSVEFVDDMPINKTDVTLTFSNNTLLEALKMCYDQFATAYTISKTDRTITIGGADTIQQTFSFGKGNGLRDIEKTIDTSYPLITKLRVVGSDKNMSKHYYYYEDIKKQNYKCKDYIQNYYVVKGNIEGDNTYRIYFNTHTDYKLKSAVTIKVYGDTQLIGNWTIGGGSVNEINDIKFDYSFVQLTQQDVNAFETWIAQRTAEIVSNSDIYYAVPHIIANPSDMEKCDHKYWIDYIGKPELLAVNNLQLPEYGTYDDNGVHLTDVYLTKNTDIYGVREGFVSFSSEDDENGVEEIYPTITNTNNKVTQGSSITDDGIFGATEKNIANFTIKICDIGFDLNDTRPDGQTEFGTLCMKDGMCGGREFKIAKCIKNDDNTYTLELNRADDDSLGIYLPTKDYPIKVNDTFVITDIEMPDEYIETAAALLKTKAQAYLNKYSVPHYSYNVTIDNIFIARQHDQYLSEQEDDSISESDKVKSIYLNIKEGDFAKLGSDEDISLSATKITIDKLTIKENGNNLPQLSVTLRNEKKENTLLKISRKVGAVTTIADNAVKTAKKVSINTSNESSSSITTDATLSNNLSVNKLVGGIEQNNPAKSYDKGTKLETILRDMLFVANKATITVSGGGNVMYGTKANQVTIKVTIKQNDSGAINSLTLYDPFTQETKNLFNAETTKFSNGTYSFNYTSTSESNITSNKQFVISADIAAGENVDNTTLNTQVNITPRWKYFYGTFSTAKVPTTQAELETLANKDFYTGAWSSSKAFTVSGAYAVCVAVPTTNKPEITHPVTGSNIFDYNDSNLNKHTQITVKGANNVGSMTYEVHTFLYQSAQTINYTIKLK